jgi:hypothetical protein
VDETSLIVSYYASAELGCHIVRGWPMPVHVLDLCAEFKRHTCGLSVPNGRALLGALAYYGLPALESAIKDEMRELAMREGPFTEEQKKDMLDYCQTDVDALAALLPAMLPEIDLPRALIRGRYVAALARVEWRGVPVTHGGKVDRAAATDANEPDPDAVIGAEDTTPAHEGKGRRRGGEGRRPGCGLHECPAAEGPVAVCRVIPFSHKVLEKRVLMSQTASAWAQASVFGGRAGVQDRAGGVAHFCLQEHCISLLPRSGGMA